MKMASKDFQETILIFVLAVVAYSPSLIADFTFDDRPAILENNDVRVALPKVSDWPTFPQVFIKGELIGGADIIAQMHESGELKKLIDSLKS